MSISTPVAFIKVKSCAPAVSPEAAGDEAGLEAGDDAGVAVGVAAGLLALELVLELVLTVALQAPVSNKAAPTIAINVFLFKMFFLWGWFRDDP